MILLVAALHAEPLTAPALLISGPERVELDLWRAGPGADKVHVLAELPDGSRELFLLDTGATTSILHREVAERLGLEVKAVDMLLEGLGGSVELRQAVLPRLGLGEMELGGVAVAVDVPGVPESAGPLPVAGILGNNVWSNFLCAVDYPADVLELVRPDAAGPPRGPPMDIADLHTNVAVRMRTRGGRSAVVPLKVDTGARDLLLLGAVGEPFRDESTVGEEPVYGVGADLDNLPASSLLRTTRRVQVAWVRAGGRRVPMDAPARWLEPDGPRTMQTTLPGLLGYRTIGGYTAIFDFPGRRFRLVPSRRAPRAFDAVGAYLALERTTHGEDPARAAVRARLQHASGDVAGARASLVAGLAAHPQDGEVAALLAWMHRVDRDWEGAIAAVADLPPLALVRAGAWTELVGALILAGRPEEALRRAEGALAVQEADRDTVHADTTKARVGSVETAALFVALSDALFAMGRTAEASAAIEQAGTYSPSRHLLRRARLAALDGDRHGAQVALRDLVRLYPLDGIPLWLYATLCAPEEVPTFLADLDAAMARLHPGDEPWDFVGASLLAVGQEERARAALDAGYDRDCLPQAPSPDRDNCEAWYWALGGVRLPEAQQRIAGALVARPWSSAFRDTAAMVAWAGGDRRQAREQAREAALLSPDDPYLLWQLARMDATLLRRP